MYEFYFLRFPGPEVSYWLGYLLILFSFIQCSPSDLQNANDVYSREFNETQILICLLKGTSCIPGGVRTTVQPLVQYNFTAGSLVNSGSLVLALGNQEAPPGFTSGKDGDANGALNFTANNQHYTGSDASLPLGASPRTFCSWIKPTSLPGNGSHRVVFRYGDPNVSGSFAVLAISNASGNKVSFLGSGYDALADYTMPVNTWSHLCSTYNGGNTADFYVNGIFIATAPFVGTGPINTISTSFAIGTWTGSGGPAVYWVGALDDVRIYNIALNANQIGQMYQTGFVFVE
ncbi:LamG domain-containing protein [Leptospira perdikensis]|uniref:LamG domain-containing protein n=1 Tax=Leptospira perdikensis TaxID=2484948 RepID=A0A4V3JPN8_9LEPT|nr:LamG domain-containing protein [Leptospira perdikensis]TGL45611.1 LamG domain-containing protein [Leptospira perdikensis]